MSASALNECHKRYLCSRHIFDLICDSLISKSKVDDMHRKERVRCTYFFEYGGCP